MEICRITTLSTEFLFSHKLYLGLLKDLLKWKGKLCGLGPSMYLSDSEITIKSSNWKLLARSSAAVSRNSSTEVRKNNAYFYQQRIQIALQGRIPMLLALHCCKRLVTSTKTTLRPEIVLFVVRFMCDRNGSLGNHESQMLIVVFSPSEPLRCHQSLRKRFLQHVCFEKRCVD